jgi:hypothetical protein
MKNVPKSNISNFENTKLIVCQNEYTNADSRLRKEINVNPHTEKVDPHF